MKTLMLIIVCLVTITACQSQTDYSVLRKEMVREQVKNRGISDQRILNAMLKIERHLFVPSPNRRFAYIDSALPIEEGQTISQPYIVAFMTDALDLKKDMKVLEIGTGSGYQAALLAEIVDKVYTIEIIENLGLKSRKLLQSIGYTNIHFRIGDGYAGWPDHAPYDAIIVTCAPNKIPEPLKDQLAEGGRMIIPAGSEGLQYLYLLEKKKGKLTQKNILPVRFVPMLGKDGKRY